MKLSVIVSHNFPVWAGFVSFSPTTVWARPVMPLVSIKWDGNKLTGLINGSLDVFRWALCIFRSDTGHTSGYPVG